MLKKITKKELDTVKLQMPEIVFDEIMVTYKHMIDDKIKSLMTEKLRVAD